MNVPMRSSAITAGISLLIMAIIAPIANFDMLAGLLNTEDAAVTLKNVLQGESTLRMCIFLFLVVAVLDVIVAWALYVFFSQVNRELSLLAAWLRLIYTALLLASLLFLLQALLLTGMSESVDMSELQWKVQLAMKSFKAGWEFGLLVFSLHLILLAYLSLKAGYMKSILGFLLLISGLGYLIDGTGRLVIDGYDMEVGMFTFFGEIVLIFWLLIQGRKEKANS